MPKPNLKTSSGQIIHYSDPNYDTYLKQGAKPVVAPIVPPYQPAPTVSTEDLTGNNLNVEAQSGKQQKNLDGIKNTLKDTSVYGKVATPGFINAAFNAKYGRDANKDELGLKTDDNKFGLQGATVKDVVGRLGLDKYLQDYGMRGVEDPNAGVQDNGNGAGGGTGKNNEGQPEIKSTTQQLQEMMSNFQTDIKSATAGKSKEVGLQDKMDTVSKIEAQLTEMKNSKNLKDYQEQLDLNAIEQRPIAMSFIRNQQQGYLDAKKLDKATDVYNYNQKLIEYNLSQNLLSNAQSMVKQTADDTKYYQQAMLQMLQFNNTLDRQQVQDEQWKINMDYQKAQDGYVYIPTTEQLGEYVKKYGEEYIYTDPTGKKYLKPEAIEFEEYKKKKEFDQKYDLGDFQFKETDDGNFIFNPRTGQITTSDVAQGIVGGFDISLYATDPNHEEKVSSIYNKIVGLNTTENIDAYLGQKYPNSPVTGEMIINAANKYNVDPAMIMAMMEQDSSYGTAGKGARTFNPGNVGNNDKGDEKNYGDWQSGVNAVAGWLSGHRAEGTSQISVDNPVQLAKDIFSGASTAKLSDISTKDNLRGEVTTELNKLKDEALKSGDIDGVIKASAGGKDPDSTFIQSFEKALNVIDQLGDLNASITNEKTGPIVGIIRSNNPYDEKAQAIKAQLTALVPNLARGIYGEVGVLTDNDVKLYSRTLPNLKSTEEVRNAVLGMTVRSVQRSLENKIKTQAGFGRDVSGIIDVYNSMKTTADGLLDGIDTDTSKDGEFVVETSNGSLDLSSFEN